MSRPLPFLALVLALSIPSTAPAQAASYRILPMRAGCPGSWTIGVSGLPRLGTTFYLSARSSYASTGGSGRTWILTGISDQSFAGVPLPFDLATLNPGSHTFHCGKLSTSLELILALPYQSRGRPTAVPFLVPNVPALAGQRIFQQALYETITRGGGVPGTRSLELSDLGVATLGY